METRETIEQWGIHLEEVEQLGEQLGRFYERFRGWAQTKTRDTSGYGLGYLSGLLRMETKRNMANVGRKTEMAGQNLQHFMSQSPWSGPGLIEAVQNEIKIHPVFQEAMLVLDESAGFRKIHSVNWVKRFLRFFKERGKLWKCGREEHRPHFHSYGYDGCPPSRLR